MARSQISICNGALDECPASTINSLDEDDVGARACKRRYQPTLEDLLGEHDYDGAIRRVTLAVTLNDRPGEWAYAYAMPENVASTRRILPDFAARYVASAYASTAYVLQPGQYVPQIGFYPYNCGVRYKVAGDRIYCNLASAVLEYVSYDVRLSDFRPLFFRAFELELASRIVMPILKDTKRQKELIAMAELARQRAMADDLNNSPERTFDFVSEEAAVRVGNAPVGYGGPWGGWG